MNRSLYVFSGSLFLVSGMGLWFLFTIGDAYFPGYNVHYDAISLLGETTAPTGTGVDIVWRVLSITWIVAVLLAFGKNRPLKRGTFANMLPALGIALTGFFPGNVNGVVHFVGAELAFYGGAIALSYDAFVMKGPYRYFSLGLAAMMFTGLAIADFPHDFWSLALGLGGGGVERLVAYPLIAWAIGIGGTLLGSHSQVRAMETVEST